MSTPSPGCEGWSAARTAWLLAMTGLFVFVCAMPTSLRFVFDLLTAFSASPF